MLLAEGYKTYNSSWIKFIGACFWASVLKTPALRTTVLTAYFAHNLYAQYCHNKSREKTFALSLNENEVIEGIAKPTYCDVYTVYNLAGLAIELLELTREAKDYCSKEDDVLGNLLGLVGACAKIGHLFAPSHYQYEFIDKATEEEISFTTILHSSDISFVG